ncbi:uncharacterized protein EHS24_001738 [Apiotrichum porosum]|uniref:Uncharacterized protein n=1 Tax=Apiotrichum porosum TaxID=105984 RepID=A0A427XJ63_9TREE|nr:uncharacterized protein EHS24_001738 [Apiotrichum porosum]RSH78823.1 hypothetical protein EHS24_001738 [Apiotrichum porosum]
MFAPMLPPPLPAATRTQLPMNRKFMSAGSLIDNPASLSMPSKSACPPPQMTAPAPSSTAAQPSSPPHEPAPALMQTPALSPSQPLTRPPFRKRVSHQRATLARARRFVAKIAPLYLHPGARPAVAAFMGAYLQLRQQVERDESCGAPNCCALSSGESAMDTSNAGPSTGSWTNLGNGLGPGCARAWEAVIAREAERRRADLFHTALQSRESAEPMDIDKWRSTVASWRSITPPGRDPAHQVDLGNEVDHTTGQDPLTPPKTTTGEGLAHRCCECRGLGLGVGLGLSLGLAAGPETKAPVPFLPASPERERAAGEALMFLATGAGADASRRRKRVEDSPDSDTDVAEPVTSARKRMRILPTPDSSDEEDQGPMTPPTPTMVMTTETTVTTATTATASTDTVEVKQEPQHPRGRDANREREEYETDDGDEHTLLSAAFDRRASEVFFSMLRGRVVGGRVVGISRSGDKPAAR